jgi:hypothetical protein
MVYLISWNFFYYFHAWFIKKELKGTIILPNVGLYLLNAAIVKVLIRICMYFIFFKRVKVEAS